MRVFLDANILFSAAASDGAVRRAIKLLNARGHECFANAYVINEARRNLRVKNAAAFPTLADLIRQMHILPDAIPSATDLEAAEALPPPRIVR